MSDSEINVHTKGILQSDTDSNANAHINIDDTDCSSEDDTSAVLR